MSKSIISVMQANGEGWACSNKPLSPLGGEQPEPDHEDRAITQLAGCLMASEGNTELDGRSDVFGWSPAYQSIVELHLSRELLMELYRELDGCVWRREDGGENRIAVCMANIKSALSPEPAKCGKCGGSVEVSGLTGGDRTAPLHWESRPCPACTEPAAPQGEDAPKNPEFMFSQLKLIGERDAALAEVNELNTACRVLRVQNTQWQSEAGKLKAENASLRAHRCYPVVSEEDLGLMNRSIAEHRDEANEHRLSGDYERQIEFELLADGLSALASRLAASRGGSDE
jgi:hypothetical protein